MTVERVPRVRLRAIPDDDVFVVRGDELDADVLTADASRFFERFADWGRYGVSAFHAASDEEVDVLCTTRLIRFATVVVFRRDDLEQAGVDVIPTFRTPHVTLCHADLTELVARLRWCDHHRVANPYHVAEDGT